MFLPLQAEKSYVKIKKIYDVIDTTNVTPPDVINGGANGYEQTKDHNRSGEAGGLYP